MKKDTHPTLNPVIFRDATAGVDLKMWSTMTSESTEDIDGVTYYIVRVDVSSSSHPFYTGKQHLMDASGRVEKFKAKMAKAEQA